MRVNNNNFIGHGAIGQASAFTTVREPESTVRLSPHVQLIWQKFSSDENVTRTFQICDKNMPSLGHVVAQFPVSHSKSHFIYLTNSQQQTRFNTLACIDSKHFDNGIVRLTFDDDRDAKQAYVLAVSMTHSHCKITQLTEKELAIMHGQNPSDFSNYAGQLIVTILYNTRSRLPTVFEFYSKLKVFGELKAMISITPLTMSALTIRVEYHNINDAEQAMKYLPQASNDVSTPSPLRCSTLTFSEHPIPGHQV